jgi:hypothetical protein
LRCGAVCGGGGGFANQQAAVFRFKKTAPFLFVVEAVVEFN